MNLQKEHCKLVIKNLTVFFKQIFNVSLIFMFISWICWSSKQLAQLSTYVKFLKLLTLTCYSNSTIHGFSKDPSWLTSLFLLMDMYILTIGPRLEWHMYFLMVNLIKMTYLIICQVEHLIRFNKKMTTLVKMTNNF